MKATRFVGAAANSLVLCFYCLAAPLLAQQQPSLGLQLLTNREVLLRLTASNTASVRIDAATQLPNWNPLLTLQSTGVNQHLDTAAPYLNSRFYRAEQLTGTNLTGDYLITTNGNVVFHPMYHATLVLSWNGRTIYNDPDSIPTYPTIYNGLPKADLILISHDHTDHFDSGQINAVTNSGTVLVVPGYVYSNNLSVAQRAIAAVLRYGDTTNLFGIAIEAVAATNANHPPGRGNGYVLTIADKRIYLSGDTGAIPPLRTLPNIDVAFLCMNLPYTMNVPDAADLVRTFRPKVVYPYHYQPSSPASDLNLFKRLVGADLGIEVRLRKWY